MVKFQKNPNESRINPHAKCPQCKSKLIDQVSSEDRSTVEWFHCASCGVWYNEAGEIDT
jgi:Zn ribbon nucleic-acid-binding protein